MTLIAVLGHRCAVFVKVCEFAIGGLIIKKMRFADWTVDTQDFYGFATAE